MKDAMKESKYYFQIKKTFLEDIAYVNELDIWYMCLAEAFGTDP